MERTPTFALPNEFLIWVAAKVLANCNLDLLLTEYYKERLESQLKNRDTHTQKYANSTELTDFTRLNIPTVWIIREKPSSSRPTSSSFLTPPLSPLFLPSPLSTSIPPSSLYDNSFSPFSEAPISHSSRSEPTLSPAPRIIIGAKKVNQSVMASNTPDTENVPTPPQFQASYIMPIPYSGAPGSPFFEGANVTEFLERYENVCEDYRISLAEKIRRLPLYYEMFTTRHIKSVIGFSGSDWTKISKELKKDYNDQDLAQQVSSRAYLKAFKDKPRAENSEVLQFCRQFSKFPGTWLEKES